MASLSVDEKNGMMQVPLLGSLRPKGGIRTLPFIIANEAFERLASQGLQPNMVLYLTQEYGLSAAGAGNLIFLWSAATNFTPIVAAFIADSYVGRYAMIGFGSIISLLGMIILWLTTIIPQAKPHCSSQFNCRGSTSQLLYLCLSFVLMSIGAGGIRSCSVAFGADQLDNRSDGDPDSIENVNQSTSTTLQSFFTWYYIASTVSVILAVSCVVYIQDKLGWNVGFGIPVLLMLFSAISFYLASPFYIKFKANKSLLTGFAQVLVASFRNRDIQFSSPRSMNVETIQYHSDGSSSSMSRPSENLSFLNKACIVRKPQVNLNQDGIANSDPWSLCTVSQVEELKALIRIIPIWSTGILMTVMISQGSFLVIEAMTMDRHITSSFEIPAGSISSMFTMIAMIVWLVFYDRVILCMLSKIKGRPVRLDTKGRMGLGIFMSIIFMSLSAMVESVRRKMAIRQGFSDHPEAVVNMSAMWVLPQNILTGFGESANAVAQMEFYYSELPKTMSSIASALLVLGMSVGNLVASFIVSTVDDITKNGNGDSWVSSNINRGHYDYYFWILAGLSFLNFLYFVACSKAYGPCKEEVNMDFGGDGAHLKIDTPMPNKEDASWQYGLLRTGLNYNFQIGKHNGW